MDGPGVTVSDIRCDRISATQPNATNVCAVVSRLRSLLGRDEFLHPLEVRKFTYANIGHILRSNRVRSCMATYACVYMNVLVLYTSVVSRQISKKESSKDIKKTTGLDNSQDINTTQRSQGGWRMYDFFGIDIT